MPKLPGAGVPGGPEGDPVNVGPTPYLAGPGTKETTEQAENRRLVEQAWEKLKAAKKEIAEYADFMAKHPEILEWARSSQEGVFAVNRGPK